MECPICRTSNASGIKYCIRCGRNLENPQEVNYVRVNAEDYTTENEYDFGKTVEKKSENNFDFISQFETDSIDEFDFSGQSESALNNSVINDEPLVTKPYTEYENNSMPLPAPPYNDMYNQPYNSSGATIYSQPIHSQIIGYDQNGYPVYSQSQFAGYQSVNSKCSQQSINMSVPVMSQKPQYSGSFEHKKIDDDTKKFIEFLDDETEFSGEVEDNFFEKSSDISKVDVPVNDINTIKKQEQKKTYMTDVEIKDAKNLIPNTSDKFNRKYMKQAEMSNSNDLGIKKSSKKVVMGETDKVDANMLNPKFNYKSRIKMGDAGQADPDTLETHTPKHKKFTMATADHAVEAMPKKKKYTDELDLIRLPKYMHNNKKSKENEEEFPSMSDL